MDEISIERLVLEVPGLSPEAAHDLAQQVGAGLAAATKPAQGGSFDSLTVSLDGFDRGSLPRLADAIVQSVMRQIG
jgi:hypothetical protein